LLESKETMDEEKAKSKPEGGLKELLASIDEFEADQLKVQEEFSAWSRSLEEAANMAGSIGQQVAHEAAGGSTKVSKETVPSGNAAPADKAATQTAQTAEEPGPDGHGNDFTRAEAEYWPLRGKLAAGRLLREAFEEACRKLEVTDSRGRLWRLHPDDADWLVFDGKSWLKADPHAEPVAAQPDHVEQTRAVDGEAPAPTGPGFTVSVKEQKPVPGEEDLREAPIPVPVCRRCNAAVPVGQELCEKCAMETASIAPLPVDAGALCPKCGAVLRPNKSFCTKCGEPVQTPAGSSESKTAPGVSYEGGSAKITQAGAESPLEDSELPPPPPPSDARVQEPGRFASKPEAKPTQVKASERVEPELPPSYEPWGFQDQLTGVAANVIGFLNQSGLSSRTGLGAMLPRMIRAVLLDKTVFREVAADASLQSEAWQVMILVILLSCSGVLIASIQHLSASSLYSIVPTAVLQIVAILVRIWLTQVVASSWLKTRTSFNQFFRALVYAQSPVSLQIIPVAGQFIGLWTLITSTAAIRDITGCNTKNAAILAIVSILGAMEAVSLAGPFVQTLLAKL
jgi:ribosomal protein L40E